MRNDDDDDDDDDDECAHLGYSNSSCRVMNIQTIYGSEHNHRNPDQIMNRIFTWAFSF
jgi:hypothetical protein